MKRILFFSAAFTICLYTVRVSYTESFLFLFIPWNLFLAWLPFFFSERMEAVQNKWTKVFWFCCWLLFWPNAPYLITDLVHLRDRQDVPFYFDLILLFSAAWNGLLLGLVSLQQVEKQMLLNWQVWKVRCILIVLFLLSGFGIYLGRYDRYNSWHIVTRPWDLITDISGYLSNPLQHIHTWAVTILFAAVFALVYETMRQFQLHSRIKTDSNTL